MARTYHTVIPPGRRWGLAAAAGLTTLALSAGLGNPWSTAFIGRLDTDRTLNRFSVLVHALVILHWSTTPSGMAGYGGSGQTGRYAAALVLDLAWPVLVFLSVRMLARGLAPRRGGFALFISAWGLTGFTAALSAVAAGLTDHLIGGHARLHAYPGAMTPQFPGPSNVFTAEAATMMLLGFALGWLPAILAVLVYAIRRSTAAEERAEAKDPYVESGEETTMVDIGSRPVVVGAAARERETLNLADLEALRNARYRTDDASGQDGGGLADPRTSTFFGEGQY
jgi:hypothetical protein